MDPTAHGIVKARYAPQSYYAGRTMFIEAVEKLDSLEFLSVQLKSLASLLVVHSLASNLHVCDNYLSRDRQRLTVAVHIV